MTLFNLPKRAIADKFLLDEELDRDLRFLKDIKGELKEAFLKTTLKNGSINSDVTITIPEGSKSSAHYLLNLVDKVIDQKHKH